MRNDGETSGTYTSLLGRLLRLVAVPYCYVNDRTSSTIGNTPSPGPLWIRASTKQTASLADRSK